MTMNREPEDTGHRVVQTVHLLVAALAAIVIAIASQGWPAPSDGCEDDGCSTVASDAVPGVV